VAQELSNNTPNWKHKYNSFLTFEFLYKSHLVVQNGNFTKCGFKSAIK
jgi:hypothetical protein